jgi:hypothetical protein
MDANTPINYQSAPAFGLLGEVKADLFRRMDAAQVTRTSSALANADVGTAASGASGGSIDLSGFAQAIEALGQQIQQLAAAIDAVNARLNAASISAVCNGGNVQVNLTI